MTPSVVCRGTAILFPEGSDVMEISTVVYFISILLCVHIFCDVVVPGRCVHYNILFYGSRIVNFMLQQTVL